MGSTSTVYNGVETSWSATDRTPRTRYYRVRANGPTGQSDWSAPRSGVIYPLFVGLELRWDGEGYIRLEWYSFDVGTHLERECSNLTDADTIRCHSYHWYNPNPEDWESDSWDSYYSVSTGHFRSSSSPSDPAWKWGYPWILPYDWQLRNGEVFWIDGQIFRASGPYSGYTAFGQAVQYWQLVNRDKFLFHHEDGSDWKQYVHSGDITLWYDAGPTRVLLHGDILRRFYYKGKKTGETVRYIDNLTLSNAFSGGMLAVTRSEDLEVNEDYQLIERELAHGKPCWPVPLRNWKHADIFQIPDHAAAIE